MLIVTLLTGLFHRGDGVLVKMLLQAGADPESSTDLGMTPSDVVCEWVSADKDRRSNVRELLKSTPQEMAKVCAYVIWASTLCDRGLSSVTYDQQY